ncbi:MAG: YitT family protein [Clostridia bacterium]|nr:YitT family protein [Clostridia bacterium]
MLKKLLTIYIKEYFFIALGSMLMAISTALILLPNQLSTGGFSGISTIFYYLFNYPVGTTTIILNIPLLLVSFFKINKSLFVKSIIGTILLSVFTDLLEVLDPITNDRFLACIYGGIIMGLGTAIILKAGASTGGTDLLSYVIRSYNNKFTSGRLIIISDIIIIFFNILFFGKIEIGLYSAIAIYLMGKMIDIVFEGIYFTKVMFIISNKYDEISRQIGIKVKRGSTGIYSKGMYSGEDKIMLFCVASRKEIAEIKQIIKKIDKNAFIVTTDARETLGEGFSE